MEKQYAECQINSDKFVLFKLNLIFGGTCITDINNIDNQLDATITV